MQTDRRPDGGGHDRADNPQRGARGGGADGAGAERDGGGGERRHERGHGSNLERSAGSWWLLLEVCLSNSGTKFLPQSWVCPPFPAVDL